MRRLPPCAPDRADNKNEGRKNFYEKFARKWAVDIDVFKVYVKYINIILIRRIFDRYVAD